MTPLRAGVLVVAVQPTRNPDGDAPSHRYGTNGSSPRGEDEAPDSNGGDYCLQSHKLN